MIDSEFGVEQFDAISAVLEKQAGVEPLLQKVTNIMVIDVKTSSSKFKIC